MKGGSVFQKRVVKRNQEEKEYKEDIPLLVQVETLKKDQTSTLDGTW